MSDEGGVEVRVRNWTKFQHYGKRNPPWIKLHRELLTDAEWFEIGRDAGWLLVNIWMLAAGSEEPGFAGTCKHIAFNVRADASKVLAWLEVLESHGFIELASTTLAPRYQDARPEQRRGETEESRADETKQARELVPEPHHDLLERTAERYDDPAGWMRAFGTLLGEHATAQQLERLTAEQRGWVAVEVLTAISEKGGDYPPDQRWWKRVAVNAADRLWREQNANGNAGKRLDEESAARWAY